MVSRLVLFRKLGELRRLVVVKYSPNFVQISYCHFVTLAAQKERTLTPCGAVLVQNNHTKKKNLTKDLEDLVAASEDNGWKTDEETSGKIEKKNHGTLTQTLTHLNVLLKNP